MPVVVVFFHFSPVALSILFVYRWDLVLDSVKQLKKKKCKLCEISSLFFFVVVLFSSLQKVGLSLEQVRMNAKN